METAVFTYVTYIKTTAEQVWNALTTGDVTRKFWSNHRNVSDFKVGSPWKHEDFDNAAIVDVAGTVLESVRPKRLALSWESPAGAVPAAHPSRVAFDIEEDAGMVRVVLIHDQLAPNSATHEGISEGWPEILSSLKSLLETGAALPAIWQRDGKDWIRVKFV